VRTNINNLAFGRLFDLANSSALAILLDTSSSMQAEIDAVKLQIKQIIEVKMTPMATFSSPKGHNLKI
jgi:hypothetical protein